MPFATFERFQIEMPVEAVRDCSRQGQCYEDVAAWLPRLTIKATPDQIRDELREYGAWDADELACDYDNLLRIVWIAACMIRDEQ